MRTASLLAGFALAVSACTTTIGGGGGGDDDVATCGNGVVDPGEQCDDGNAVSGDGCSSTCQTEAVPMVTAMVDMPTIATELGKTETLTLTVTSVNGFAGAVALTPSVLDASSNVVAGWTLTPTPASVTLVAGGTATATLTVMIPTDDQALTATVKIDLASTAAAVDVASAFTVANQVTIVIDAGTGATSPHADLPAPNSIITIHTGAKLVFHNADAINHVIHGDGGIAHEDLALGLPNTDYIVTPTDDGTWYCHDHEASGQARLVNLLP